MKKKFKKDIFYEIYVRSFYDSNNDGVGDLQGVTDKLDYLKDLGITGIWLTPFYQSPNEDNGYDISDYYSISEEYGDMDAFENLLDEAHKRDIKVIIDMVLNHTSAQHHWFKESRSSKDNPKRDYYIWRDGKDGREPNNWSSAFSPSAWEYDEITNQYYMHYYAKNMPDLNWDNPKLRKEICDMLNWWLEKGVDGFRLDSINTIKKPKGLPDGVTPDPDAEGYFFDMDKTFNISGIMDIMDQLNVEVFSKHDAITVGEISYTDHETMMEYVGANKSRLDMAFNFENAEYKLENGLNAKELGEILVQRYENIIAKGGWDAQVLGNHDMPRPISFYGNDAEHREKSGMMLCAFHMTLPGTPFIYQGEEIGMTNVGYETIDYYDDIYTKHTYTERINSGDSPEQALKNVRMISRDNARSPMQWEPSENGGFTQGTPWLKVNDNYIDVNVLNESKKHNGVLKAYKSCISHRKENSALTIGTFELINTADEDVLCYKRSLNNEEIVVILNFSDNKKKVEIDIGFNKQIIFNNYEKAEEEENDELFLKPWQAIIYR